MRKLFREKQPKWHKFSVEISLSPEERALKVKASDSDEKMMMVERSYPKGAL